MKEILKYSGCFVCGEKNSCGLKARFFYDDDRAVTEVFADEIYEGYRGVFHGGILSTLLDEVMIKAILAKDIYTVTAEFTVKFVKPVRTGDKIRLVGKILNRRGRLFFTEGQAFNENGELYAEASGKYLEARPELKEILVQSID